MALWFRCTKQQSDMGHSAVLHSARESLRSSKYLHFGTIFYDSGREAPRTLSLGKGQTLST